ncbi:keratin, type I cytoskeletal 9-like [Zingiber officinale]|uniref:keratin, type I cytoskeletal 9-like n=1 Tax=Zingiber officinale TaxID=94328 RepID=UPI001C4BB2A3|nr:keratin, type I cytoskeletal 9-like [Zingiber officinale]
MTRDTELRDGHSGEYLSGGSETVGSAYKYPILEPLRFASKSSGGDGGGGGGGRGRSAGGGSLSWGAEAAVGAVLGGDPGPVEEDAQVAGDLRHGGGGRAGVRRGRAQPARPQGEDQLRIRRRAAGGVGSSPDASGLEDAGDRRAEPVAGASGRRRAGAIRVPRRRRRGGGAGEHRRRCRWRRGGGEDALCV